MTTKQPATPARWAYSWHRPLPILIFIFSLLCSTMVSFGQTVSPDLPWQIFADHVNYDKKTHFFTATGNVSLVQGNRKIVADRIRYRTDTLVAEALGNVVVTVGNDILTGEKMELDLRRETGMIHNGRAFFQARNFHITGYQIEKTGAKTYAAKKATITTCDGETPDWKITGRDVKVTVEGYATAWHTALWIKKLPIFYVPYLVVPVKQKRQSGLLAPQFVISDSRNGVGYTQPVFWAISSNTDATFYWQSIEKRGNKWGAEFRYVLDPRSKGTVMFDYLDDRQVDDGVGNSSDLWGYTHDNQLRPNNNRYWFRMKHDQLTLPLGLTAKIDLDIVSDQDYLLEFKDGITGFDTSDAYFLHTFGRDLDDFNESVRRNIINIGRTWSKFRLNTGATWYDDVIRRQFSENDPTIQQLPWVTFNGSKQSVFKTLLYYTLDTRYIHYYRADSDTNSDITRLHEAELYPRLFLPFKAGRFFTIEPFAGWRYNYWYVNETEDNDPGQKKSFDRNIYDIGGRFSSEVYRIYQIGGTRIDKIKHAIRPQIFYDYTPETDQDDLPNFSPVKAIEKKNVITYSLISAFTSKLKKTDQKENKTKKYDYREFLRLFLSQSYDLDEASNDVEEPKPFAPLFGEIRFRPSSYFWAKADMKWDTYENNYLEKNVEAAIRDKRGDRLHASYRIKGNQQEHLKFYLYAAITNRLSTHVEYERDMIAREDVKRRWGWLYRADCWTFSVDYIEETNDQKFAFSISLHGLGGFRHSFGGNVGDGE